MLRLARISIVFLLLLPLNAAPLGLGDIQLRSALNQPLNAQIELTALGQTRIEDISVRLASREAFAQVGLERPLFLADLKFIVERSADGLPIVRISSGQAITEPFLDFLVEMNWPNGRLLREYTVLLDPPLLLDEAPAPIAAPAAGTAVQTARPAQAAPAPQAQPAARQPAAARPGAQAQQGADGAWSYGPVERDATLWSIAQELRALDGSYSVEQIMMALLRSNPEAFYNGNVNELKAGYVLRIDDPAAIGVMSRAAAIAETRRQTEQWLDAKRSAAELAANRPQGAGEAQATAGTGSAAAAPAGPRLRLSAPEAADADRLAGSVEGESEGGTAQRLRQELAEALEVSESARQENVELRQRLAALEEQITSMQRLLTLQEDTLANLQSNRAEAQAAPAERRAPAPAEPAGKAQDNPFTTLLNDPMMLGVGGAAVLLLATLGWLIARRRQMARASLEEFTAQPALDSRRAPVMSAAAAGGAAGLAAEELDDAVAGAAASDDGGVDLMQADEDEIDILAEADVYLAYRRFDKAEELLKEAMREDPERRDLALKLLEVYVASGDGEAFVTQAESLRGALGGHEASTWDKIVAMGKRLAPAHPLFAAASAAHAVEPAAAAETADAGHGSPDAGFAGSDGGEGRAAGNASAADFDLTLDEETLAGLEVSDIGGAAARWQGGGSTGGEAPVEGAFEAGPVADAAAEQPGYPGSLSDMAAEAAKGAADDGQEQEQDIKTADNELDLGGDIDWLSAVGEDLAAFESDSNEGEDFSGLISGTDEIGTKLDLAKAYIDMGDQESARSILSEVSEEGSEDQQREASDLMRQIG